MPRRMGSDVHHVREYAMYHAMDDVNRRVMGYVLRAARDVAAVVKEMVLTREPARRQETQMVVVDVVRHVEDVHKHVSKTVHRKQLLPDRALPTVLVDVKQDVIHHAITHVKMHATQAADPDVPAVEILVPTAV